MKFKPLYFAIVIFVLAVVGLIYTQLGNAQKTVPKVKLSYFSTLGEFAEAIQGRLQQEILSEKSFWFGVEPEKPNHVKLAIALIKVIEKSNGPFDEIFFDKELQLKPEELADIPQAKEVLVRDEWPMVADQILSLKDKKYFLITASIYSTSFLRENPVHKIKNKTQQNIMTFSSGHFSIDLPDEKNSVFPCNTDDKEGISAWSCAVIGKARTQRKKLNMDHKNFAGLMDLSGEKDYMILLR
jgi:hypothetical protein